MKKIKVKDELQGKEYLIDLFQTLDKNLQYEREFYAMEEIVEKMYQYDKEQAIEWTMYLLNKFATKGLSDFRNGYCKEADVNSFIEGLMFTLCINVPYKNLIYLIHNKIFHACDRIYIWKFVLNSENFNAYFIDYIQEILNQNNDKEYTELRNLFACILDNQNLIEEDAFDLIDFLIKIFDTFVDKEYIKNQKQLDFFYSLLEYVPYQPDNALLKSYFIDFI